MILLRFEAMRVRSQFFLAEKNGQIFFRSFLIELCQQPGACQEICHGRGGGNFVPTRKNFAPPPKLILCKIYHFISSFGLQKSYHSKPKIMDFKRLGGGLNHLGGGACPCPLSPLLWSGNNKDEWSIVAITRFMEVR